MKTTFSNRPLAIRDYLNSDMVAQLLQVSGTHPAKTCVFEPDREAAANSFAHLTLMEVLKSTFSSRTEASTEIGNFLFANSWNWEKLVLPFKPALEEHLTAHTDTPMQWGIAYLPFSRFYIPFGRDFVLTNEQGEPESIVTGVYVIELLHDEVNSRQKLTLLFMGKRLIEAVPGLNAEILAYLTVDSLYWDRFIKQDLHSDRDPVLAQMYAYTLNLICYLGCDDADIASGVKGSLKASMRNSHGFPKFADERVVGETISKLILERSNAGGQANGNGSPVMMHLRRGHWKTQWFGALNASKKRGKEGGQRLKNVWIKPTWVNRETEDEQAAESVSVKEVQ